jgi:hypothetical protein
MPNIGAVKSFPALTQHKDKLEQDFAAQTGSAIATQRRGAILVNSTQYFTLKSNSEYILLKPVVFGAVTVHLLGGLQSECQVQPSWPP